MSATAAPSRGPTATPPRAAERRRYPRSMAFDPTCPSGVCGSEAPPLIGSVLTGAGLTLQQAARALERGERLPLTDVQLRLVEQWAERQVGAAHRP